MNRSAAHAAPLPTAAPGRLLRKDIAMNRFPLKHLADAAALAKVLVRGDVIHGRPLGLAKRLDCLRFYFQADGVFRLHAVLPRAGTLWSELGMTLAIDLAQGGDGEYAYEKGLFWPRDGLAYRRLDWRVPTGAAEAAHGRDGGPAFGRQLYFHSRHPYFRIRSARLKTMRIVVLTRSVLDCLESQYFKQATDPTRGDVVLDDENSFPWDMHLTQAIEFYNSWGDVLTWHPTIRHYRYEDLKADPVSTHKEILDFWGFDVPGDCIAEGFRRASKVEMKKRMPPAERNRNPRVPDRSTNHRGAISEARTRHIIDRLKRELVHTLGHDYDHGTAYGREYD